MLHENIKSAYNYIDLNADCRDVITKKVSQNEGIGYCILSPDNVLTDKIFNSCKTNGINCKMIDPLFGGNDSFYSTFSSINPLYIPNYVTSEHILGEIESKAKMFADVIQLIGAKIINMDSNFISTTIRILATGLAELLMCSYHYNKKRWSNQPTLMNILDTLNDFSQTEDYFNDFKNIFMKKHNKYNQENSLYNTISYSEELLNKYENGDSHALECVGKLNDILKEILKDSQTNKIFGNYNPINFDMELASNGIILINYATDNLFSSTAIGLFCIKALNRAIIKRSGKSHELPPFVLVIDEHDEYSNMFISEIEPAITSMSRKYNVSIMLLKQHKESINLAKFYKTRP